MREYKCDCVSCRHSRGELTTEHAIISMQNRLEVWQIVRSYFDGYCDISEKNLHMLGQNIYVAIEELEEFLICLKKRVDK